jgi:hypothetical protein
MAVGSRAAKMYGKAQQKPDPAHQRHALHEWEEEQDKAQTQAASQGSSDQGSIQWLLGSLPPPQGRNDHGGRKGDPQAAPHTPMSNAI